MTACLPAGSLDVDSRGGTEHLVRRRCGERPVGQRCGCGHPSVARCGTAPSPLADPGIRVGVGLTRFDGRCDEVIQRPSGGRRVLQ